MVAKQLQQALSIIGVHRRSDRKEVGEWKHEVHERADRGRDSLLQALEPLLHGEEKKLLPSSVSAPFEFLSKRQRKGQAGSERNAERECSKSVLVALPERVENERGHIARDQLAASAAAGMLHHGGQIGCDVLVARGSVEPWLPSTHVWTGG